ncbi:MAG: ribonuclease HII [Pseudomonadota bacterium]
MKIIRLAGIDEAGRGPLAGPVVAAAVILDQARPIDGLNDSKKLKPAQRDMLALEIRGKALAVGIGLADPKRIDRMNILQATLWAMGKAVEGLAIPADEAIIDGNQLPRLEIPATTLVGGDGLHPAISAASIIAKTHRDALMVELDQRYPGYGFARHKGYPTPAHLEALERLGPCPEHRQSFRPVTQANLF